MASGSRSDSGVLPAPDEKARAVQGMFSAIAPRYDLLNHLLSLNIDRSWRRRAVDILLQGNHAQGRYLDACAGTMDLAVEIARRGATAIATDFAYPMLEAGQEKTQKLENLKTACGDALRLPFRDAEFNGAVVGFGVRNLASVTDGIRELARVLKPGGKLVILEFTTPQWQPFRALYMSYFKYALPTIGRLVSRHRSAYTYLPASVLQFPEPQQLASMMTNAGLKDVKWETRTGGVVAIHSGVK